MAFQSVVNINQGFGVVGDWHDDSPRRVSPLVINSSGIANCIGYAYTKSNSTNVASVGGTIGSGVVFAGILTHPKSYASHGTAVGGTLAPSNALLDNVTGEFATMGTLVVHLASAANIGDKVVYDTATGELSAVAASASSAGTGKAFVPNCLVHNFATSAAGLVAISLTN